VCLWCKWGDSHSRLAALFHCYQQQYSIYTIIASLSQIDF